MMLCIKELLFTMILIYIYNNPKRKNLLKKLLVSRCSTHTTSIRISLNTFMSLQLFN